MHEIPLIQVSLTSEDLGRICRALDRAARYYEQAPAATGEQARGLLEEAQAVRALRTQLAERQVAGR